MVAILDFPATANRASKRIAILLWLGVFTFAAVVVATAFPRVDMSCKKVMVSSLVMIGGGIVTEPRYQLVVGKVKVTLPPAWTRKMPREWMMLLVKNGRCT